MKRLTGRRGTSTLGMALTLTLLGVLVLGAADLGRLAYDLTLVANAVGAGLSDGSMGHSEASDGTKDRNLGVADKQDVEGVSVVSNRFCQCADGSVVSCDDGTCSVGTPRIYVWVRAYKVYQTILPYPGIPSSITLDREGFMRVVR